MTKFSRKFLCVALASIGLLFSVAASSRAEEAKPLPKSVDLRPNLLRWGLDTRLQRSRNTCSVFVVAESLEYALASKGNLDSRLSIEFLNWAANQAETPARDGANFADLWTGLETYGVCPEADMPYEMKLDPAKKPSEEAFAHAKAFSSKGLKLHWIKEWDGDKGVDEKQLAEIKRTLSRGYPVCGGFLWPKDHKVSTRMLKVVPRDQVMDGHSVFIVGYQDDATQPGGGILLYRNTAGRHRHGKMTYEYALTYMNDAIYVDYGEEEKQ
jgi:hypothetical protein